MTVRIGLSNPRINEPSDCRYITDSIMRIVDPTGSVAAEQLAKMVTVLSSGRRWVRRQLFIFLQANGQNQSTVINQMLGNPDHCVPDAK